ncbi:MAG: 5-formyltetrahydrofolate cyclo-ligase [Ferrovum sp. 37-45-19]|jgi:5-formyltetrahydrofolate cyclo-ligase|nr:MAG: 5-formyltetrahydrofolate cyclo-ligase [Ferrovum sp. 21-44-67]OYV95039.1 MAG: 5-formyltetrahydrofolate cyclo-ligase [Ferrovum sp. 37-45-19]OZB32205.1 MAG: 5-formyltetrahydrofolate cyclo-ligase [Ferrovum sp. 34-44-207]HQT80905.1 5-formyltetrahydrofolate cyclo-ligase [Ferrovaceae bacterium]HQU06645.1 5-formyltetrahydrofolate cyclo-ligase [Ferrovaceae bacterium]
MNADQKKMIRKRILTERDQLDPQERQINENLIFNRFVSEELYSRFNSFMVYASFGNEVNTWPLIDYLYQHTTNIIFPKVDAELKVLELYRVKDREHLVPGIWGILEPDESRCEAVLIDDIDCILVPGLAYDKEGYRIGYGGGYYDKLLANQQGHSYKISIGFEFQRLERIPRESHDCPIDLLITETESYYFSHPAHE